MRTFILLLAVTVGSCVSAKADWQLAGDDSTFAFTSTKNETITETHRFKTLTASVDAKGKAQLEVSLKSVDTNIPLRDERMQKILFAAAQTATFTSMIEPEVLALEKGQQRSISLLGQLHLNGVDAVLSVPVLVSRGDDGDVLVSGTGELDVADFGFSEGLNQLRLLAGLEQIATKVGFTIALRFSEI